MVTRPASGGATSSASSDARQVEPQTGDGSVAGCVCQGHPQSDHQVSYGDGVGLHLSQIDEADELLTRTPEGSLASLTIFRVPRTRWRC
jgi:hypothetical protein